MTGRSSQMGFIMKCHFSMCVWMKRPRAGPAGLNVMFDVGLKYWMANLAQILSLLPQSMDESWSSSAYCGTAGT